MKKITAILAALMVAASFAGCGTISKLASGAAINAVQHTSFGRKHSTLIQGAWCAYHVYLLEQDVRHHKLGWGAFQGALAAHHCARVAHL
jgi:uncharacterized protein YceK